MMARVIFWILAFYQFASRSNSASLKPTIPSSSPTSVPVASTYSLNRTGSKFNGFGNNKYYKNYSTKNKQQSNQMTIPVLTNAAHVNIHGTFGSISISSLKNVVFILLLSVFASCIFIEFQQRKAKNVAEHTETEPVVCSDENNPSNIIHINPLPNTQIILDYDDTLFPTAYTDQNIKNGINSSEYIIQQEWDVLHELNNCVCQILLLFIELFGAPNVCIVTNASLLWVNQSCLIYNGLYERMRALIINHQIQVISATESYRSQKSSAFMAVLRNKKHINKVICVGDSLQEYDDIDTVCSVLRLRRRRTGNNINYSRFKLNDQPSLKVMLRQLQFLKTLNYHSISQQKYDQSYQLNI